MTINIEALPTCEVCERPLRPYRTSPADYPGTISRVAETLCATHGRDRTKLGPRPSRRDLVVQMRGRGEPMSHKHNVIALSDFLAPRNARIIARSKTAAYATVARRAA